MPNRILKESICESKKLSEVSFFAEDLYKRLITYADDYGRFNADYRIMLVRLYPREIQIVNESDIEDALIELAGAGKVAFYTDDAREEIYGCLPKWFEHQRVRDSKKKAPDPHDTRVNDWYLKRFVPMGLKKKIIERDGFKCQECGKYICNVPTTAERLIKMGAGLYHLDHVVPVAQGGRATEENLRLLCPRCNLSRKKNYTVDEILEITLSADFCNTAASCGDLPQTAAIIQSNPNPNPNPESNAGKTRARFVPPTLEEVAAYVAERKSPVDPQGFIDFYAAKGWLVGKTPMKDWKAACRNAEDWDRWKKPERKSAGKATGPYAPASGSSVSDMDRMAKYRRELEAKREQQS